MIEKKIREEKKGRGSQELRILRLWGGKHCTLHLLSWREQGQGRQAGRSLVREAGLTASA